MTTKNKTIGTPILNVASDLALFCAVKGIDSGVSHYLFPYTAGSGTESKKININKNQARKVVGELKRLYKKHFILS